jgi:hypothetical protein
MAEALPADVRVEIDTHLDDPAISDILTRIEREWQRASDSSDFEDTQHIADFEATLAALRIAEGRDRRAEDVQSGRTQQTYETAEIDNLRQRVRRLDPGDSFGRPGHVVRDSDRYTTRTNS